MGLSLASLSCSIDLHFCFGACTVLFSLLCLDKSIHHLTTRQSRHRTFPSPLLVPLCPFPGGPHSRETTSEFCYGFVLLVPELSINGLYSMCSFHLAQFRQHDVFRIHPQCLSSNRSFFLLRECYSLVIGSPVILFQSCHTVLYPHQQYVHEASSSSPSSAELVSIYFFYRNHPSGREVASHCGSGCISPMANDVEHLFMDYLPSLCLLQRNVCSYPVPISLLTFKAINHMVECTLLTFFFHFSHLYFFLLFLLSCLLLDCS